MRDYFKMDERTEPAKSREWVQFLSEHQTQSQFVGHTAQHIQDKVKTLLRQMKK